MDGEKKKPKFSVGYLIIAFWVVLLLQLVLSGYLQAPRTSYSDFKGAVEADKVEDVAIGQTLIRGHMKAPPAPPATARPIARPVVSTGTTFETVRVDDADLTRQLQAHGVKISGVVESSFWHDAAGWLVPIAVLGFFWLMM